MLPQQHNAPNWNVLHTQLRHWAKRWWIKCNFRDDAHTAELIEECAQDAICRIFQNPPPVGANPNKWHHAILRNTCRSVMRDKYRYEKHLDGRLFTTAPEDYIDDLIEQIVDNSGSPEDQFVSHDMATEQCQRIRTAVAMLSPRDQKLIVDFFYEGKSIRKMAGERRISAELMSGRKFKTLKRLEKKLLQADA